MKSENKKTVVLGASTNPERYSNIAINRLTLHGQEVIPIGIRKGDVAGIRIINEKPAIEHVDTVTLYLNPQRQKEYYEYILSLKPKRIIFNPGAENEELKNLAEKNGISAVEECTLVLLSTGQY